MELKVTTLEGKEAGSVQLSDAIFGLEPRQDIIQRCVQWQLNKRQAGTHKAKGRAEAREIPAGRVRCFCACGEERAGRGQARRAGGRVIWN